MGTPRTYIGACDACDETLHSGDVGAIVYTSLGYGCVCEACARIPTNLSFLTSDVGPIVANPHAASARWQPWTVVAAPNSPTALLRTRRAAGTLGAYASDSALMDAARRYVSEVS